MGSFKSSRRTVQTASQELQTVDTVNKHSEAMEASWQRLTAKALHQNFRGAWAFGSQRLKAHAADLQEQVRYMHGNLIDPNAVQDLEKCCEIGERRMLSMEEACMAQMRQSANAARYVGTELSEAQVAWNARLKVITKELQEEQAWRQHAETGWHGAELHLARLQNEVVARMDRNDALVGHLDLLLRDEQAEVSELRHSLSEAEAAIGMLVVHGTPT